MFCTCIVVCSDIIKNCKKMKVGASKFKIKRKLKELEIKLREYTSNYY